jgi:hypothetical protein
MDFTMDQACGDSVRVPAVKRWRLQFSLRTLLAVVTLCGLLLGWAGMWMQGVLRQGKVAAAISERGGQVSTKSAGPEWLASLFGEDDWVVVTSVSYDGLELGDGDLALLRGLSELSSLSLDGANRKGITDEGLRQVAELTQIAALHLGDASISDKGLRHLQGLSKLEWLCLSGTGVGDAGLIHVSGMKQLKTLHLSRTAVTDAGLEHLTALEGLRLLYLTYTNVSDAGVAELQNAMPDVWIVH